MSKNDPNKFVGQFAPAADLGPSVSSAVNTRSAGASGSPDGRLTEAVVIRLAGLEFDARLLPCRKARALRRKIAELLARNKVVDPSNYNEVYTAAENILDLLYEFDPRIAAKRELIEEQATEGEIAAALIELLKVQSLVPLITRVSHACILETAKRVQQARRYMCGGTKND